MNPDLGPYAALPDFLEFMIWGDETILKAASAVGDEGYYREHNISAGSLHKLLVHAMGAQWVWLNRFRGQGLPMLTVAELPTRASLNQRWPEVHSKLREFLGEQTLASLQKPIAFRNFKGEPHTHTLGQLFFHVTDHATYHRGQQNTLMKLSGGSPVNIFYYLWSKEHRS